MVECSSAFQLVTCNVQMFKHTVCAVCLQVLNTGLTEFSFDDDEEGKGVDSGSEAGAGVEVYSSGSDFSEFGD